MAIQDRHLPMLWDLDKTPLVRIFLREHMRIVRR